MRQRKRITFLTGTRADFGKQLPLIKALNGTPGFEVDVIATGMHMLDSYGYTVNEVFKAGVENIFPVFNQDSLSSEKMDIVLGTTITQLSHYIVERSPDITIVHGDRLEAMAGALAAALNNTLVGHIEGGEVSGTIDESMRHAVSKLAHVHFVSNEESKKRLLQMGESSERIYVIGSPEIDVMCGGDLPDISAVKKHYEIPFEKYAILLFHPVTTEQGSLRKQTIEVIAAARESGDDFVVIKPNNDLGSHIILEEMADFCGQPNTVFLPSMRFDNYLSLLKNTKYMLGNSSSGVREAPVFGVPCINVGTRQAGRTSNPTIMHVPPERNAILDKIRTLPERVSVYSDFGDGNSSERFVKILGDDSFWGTSCQKSFVDL